MLLGGTPAAAASHAIMLARKASASCSVALNATGNDSDADTGLLALLPARDDVINSSPQDSERLPSCAFAVVLSSTRAVTAKICTNTLLPVVGIST